jgi:sec-independent protein translocase protein TatA
LELHVPTFSELIVILLIVVVLFGAAALPKIGKGLGDGIREFKKAMKGEEEKNSPDQEEEKKE